MSEPAPLAMRMFKQGLDRCTTQEDISKFCQMLCILSSKTIHGIEGRKFKKAFLNAAIKDPEMIEPVRVN